MSEPSWEQNLIWHDAFHIGLEGQGWTDLAPDAPASRLPARAQALVSTDLWTLSLTPNGLSVAFRTDATQVYARWTLGGPCPPEDVAGGGLDCYGQDEFGDWYWVGRTTPWMHPTADGRFNQTPLDGRERTYRVYLPLKVPVTSLSIGVDRAASFTPIAPRAVADGRGMVYYGTSIVYGIGVDRPGMAHASLLARWLDQPLVNLGFSGRAWLEPEVADLLGELDPALFLLDPLPNNDGARVRERLATFLRRLRAARPDTPILWVGDRILTDATFCPDRDASHREKTLAARDILAQLQAEGMRGLHQMPGGLLFGSDQEGTPDASHPSDLGALRMAQTMLPYVARLLAIH